MARVKKEDLESLSNEQLKSFYITEDWRKLDVPEPVMEELKKAKESYDLGTLLNRMERFIGQIVVDRFVDGKL